MKKFRLLSLLFVAVLFVQNVNAGLLLPYSSYYQGRSYFSDPNATGFVDFAVYDTEGQNEWVGAGFEAPGEGRYIYAYQIFNNDDSPNAIGSFTIMGLTPYHHLTGIADTIGSQNPWVNYQLITEGVEPTDTKFNLGDPNSSEPTRAIWEFWGPASALLSAGEYSWFLIFRSDKPWTRGQYEMQPAGGFPVIGNPEPCTLALLGLGSAILLTKRKRLHN